MTNLKATDDAQQIVDKFVNDHKTARAKVKLERYIVEDA